MAQAAVPLAMSVGGEALKGMAGGAGGGIAGMAGDILNQKDQNQVLNYLTASRGGQASPQQAPAQQEDTSGQFITRMIDKLQEAKSNAGASQARGQAASAAEDARYRAAAMANRPNTF